MALAEQVLKLALNVYRGWVAESRGARAAAPACAPSRRSRIRLRPQGTGVEIAMVLEEAEPIGGFTGISVSEPLLQGGILVSVIGYMLVSASRGWRCSGLPSSCRRWCSCRCCSGRSTAAPVRAS